MDLTNSFLLLAVWLGYRSQHKIYRFYCINYQKQKDEWFWNQNLSRQYSIDVKNDR